MGTMLDMVVQFLKDDNWNPHQVGEEPIYSGSVKADNGSWLYYAQVKEEERQFMFYSMLEFKVPPERRQAMAELLTRANYRLLVGNFEMDFADGQVRFRTSLDVEGGELTEQMLRNLVYGNVLVMNEYLPAITSVANSGADPADALAGIEPGGRGNGR